MYDQRYDRYAELIAERSLAVHAGMQILLMATTEAKPLVLALQKAILRRGAYAYPYLSFPESEEIIYHHASDEQLAATGILESFAAGHMDAILLVHSDGNPAANASVPMMKQMLKMKSMAEPMQTVFSRVAEGSMKWASCVYPSRGLAQLAGMGEAAFEEIIFDAVKLGENSPVKTWEAIEHQQQRLIDHLTGKEILRIIGEDTDLTLSVAGRRWINAAGRSNLPDGEIYTGPVEDSAEGHIYFRHPIMYKGNIASGVRMTFEKGKCVEASAHTGEEYLKAMIALDAGSSRLGEFAIGTNYALTRPAGHILIDEKIGGTVHLALGNGYPLTGSRNVSALHWDFICDLRTEGRLEADGEVIMENGHIKVLGLSN